MWIFCRKTLYSKIEKIQTIKNSEALKDVYGIDDSYSNLL